nr:hypothetical protein Iba_chr08aCG4560 [Ipomoea batatas]
MEEGMWWRAGRTDADREPWGVSRAEGENSKNPDNVHEIMGRRLSLQRLRKLLRDRIQAEKKFLGRLRDRAATISFHIELGSKTETSNTRTLFPGLNTSHLHSNHSPETFPSRRRGSGGRWNLHPPRSPLLQSRKKGPALSSTWPRKLWGLIEGFCGGFGFIGCKRLGRFNLEGELKLSQKLGKKCPVLKVIGWLDITPDLSVLERAIQPCKPQRKMLQKFYNDIQVSDAA